jgi:dienelactone hydrolase
MTGAWILLSIWFPLMVASSSGAEPMKSDVGNYYPFLKDQADQSGLTLSYLSRSWADLEQWRIAGRGKMQELLAYNPPSVPFADEILETTHRSGYTRHLIRFNVAPGRRTEAFLLIPDNLQGPAPAILAQHDHSGFYYFGKEKITETSNPAAPLRDLIEGAYEGRCFADELARRGFVVLVPDCFYFGAQRLDPKELPARYAEDLGGEEENSAGYIREFNNLASRHEALIAKTIFTAGVTWPGILFHDDRISLSYLLSRPEVDNERVGCIGLSLGGFRSAHLFGLDPRIKCGVVAGWMTTYKPMLFDHLHSHTWMLYIPRQYAYLDLPDVASLNAPRPLMVINCLQDSLFTVEGMKEADSRLREIYSRLGAPENFNCQYYDVPHSLNIQMQEDALAWLEKGLK